MPLITICHHLHVYENVLTDPVPAFILLSLNCYNGLDEIVCFSIHSDRAAKFYEQALLLVDCCKIPEAIKLLEKVCNCDMFIITCIIIIIMMMMMMM